MYHITKRLLWYITHYIICLTKKFQKQQCSICLESISNYEYSLSCGHKFHVDCIISWFRQKKDTCPCCRDTGNNIIEITNEEDWESNPIVQEFLNSENPTKDQMVNAYYIRDINMNVSVQECFESCVRGLGVNPENYKSQIKHWFVRHQEGLYKTYIQNCLDNPDERKFYFMSINFNEYLEEQLDSEQFKEKLKIYQNLEKHMMNNNHKGLYNCISREDLLGLGW